MGVLQKILASKRDELPALRTRALPAPPPVRPVSLRRARGGPLSLITEIKLRSPSAGALSTALSVGERAAAYGRAGAAAISVLCDAPFFGGDYVHLAEARAACTVPLLCKEFVVDEAQLDAARAYGADLVLLIVRCLTPERLGVLVAETRARQMVPFVEVHTAEESRHALDVGADLIGVNARDLDTLQMDVEGAARILSALPPSVTRARLSGLATTADVRRVAGTTVDAALVGEALMRQDDPEPLLKEWVAAAGGPAPIRQ